MKLFASKLYNKVSATIFRLGLLLFSNFTTPSSSFFNLWCNLFNIPIFITDEHNNVVFYNSKFKSSFFGREETVPEDAFEIIKNSITDALENKTSLKIIIKFVDINGHQKPVEVELYPENFSDNIVYIVGVAKTRNTFIFPPHFYNEHIHSIIQNKFDLVWDLNKDWKFGVVSDYFVKLSGYSKEELYEMNQDKILTKESVELFKSLVDETFVTNDNYIEANFGLNNKNNERIYLRISGIVIKSKFNEFAGFAGIAKDVTIEIKEKIKEQEKVAILDSCVQSMYKLLYVKTENEFKDLSTDLFENVANILKADRVYIAKNLIKDNEEYYERIYGWTSQAVDSLVKLYGKTEKYSNVFYDRALENIKNNNTLIFNISDMNKKSFISPYKNLKEFLAKMKVKSLITIPIYSDSVFWGFLAVYYHNQEKHWTESEITTLRLIALNFSAILTIKEKNSQLQKTRNELQRATEIMTESIKSRTAAITQSNESK